MQIPFYLRKVWMTWLSRLFCVVGDYRRARVLTAQKRTWQNTFNLRFEVVNWLTFEYLGPIYVLDSRPYFSGVYRELEQVQRWPRRVYNPVYLIGSSITQNVSTKTLSNKAAQETSDINVPNNCHKAMIIFFVSSDGAHLCNVFYEVPPAPYFFIYTFDTTYCVNWLCGKTSMFQKCNNAFQLEKWHTFWKRNSSHPLPI